MLRRGLNERELDGGAASQRKEKVGEARLRGEGRSEARLTLPGKSGKPRHIDLRA